MIFYDAHKWTDHLFDVRGSMVKQISARVLLFVAWSAVIVWFHKYVHKVDVPVALHSLVGVALGLLLVFRTNASYDRFWEGRKVWGAIVNESRNLGRGALAYLPPESPERRPIVLWTVAFARATMGSLRGKVNVELLRGELPEEEIREILQRGSVPLAISLRLSRLLASARNRGDLSDFLLGQLDENVQLLIDYLGMCERIHRTPLPFAYVVHLRRALILYFLTLPFALLEPFGWVTVLVTFIIAYVYFGIEEIGVQIEGPFGEDDNDLPLEQICDTIERDLLNLIATPEGSAFAVSGL